jgi:hypothetical protein
MNTKFERADPEQREIVAGLDMLIMELKSVNKAARNAGLRSVDLSEALAIAENLKVKILSEREHVGDWSTVMKCLLWLIEFLQKIHSFLSYKISATRGRCEYRRNHKTHTHYRWHLSKRVG